MRKNKTLTVFTPTYNRADRLNILYRSLAVQTNKDFLWLVVDDGSTDNTKELVSAFKDENIIEIRYVYEENSGKYIAHNTAVRQSDTELFTCVDSDDKLRPDAVEKTLAFWNEHKDNKKVCGIVSPQYTAENTGFVNPPKYSTLLSLYDKGQLIGETLLVYKTDILKKYLFPENKGEKFLVENIVYGQIDRKYVLAVQNEVLCVGDYCPDGLTQNIEAHHWDSPKNTLLMYKHNAAYGGLSLKAIKSYGAYLAWKKVRRLKSVRASKPVNLITALLGNFLVPHYAKIFKSNPLYKK